MDGVTNDHILARAMVDTVRESLLVLDADLRVVAASRSFYATFQTDPAETRGRLIYDLGSGEWKNPALRDLLEHIIPEHGVMDHFEVEQDFPHIGRRTMLLNARKVFYQANSNTTLLLAIEDITERRTVERRLQALMDQKDTLLSEMNHRVANSLQIVASILLLKARSVLSEETRGHLEDAHRRVMSIASLQQQLRGSGLGEQIDVGNYLSKLCETLSASMMGDKRKVVLRVVASAGAVASDIAVSMGLVVTELVINALKYAFSDDVVSGEIIVGYEVKNDDWNLSVSDNGSGMIYNSSVPKSRGLGNSLVKALAQQLEGKVETVTGANGTTVSIVHAAFSSDLPIEAIRKAA